MSEPVEVTAARQRVNDLCKLNFGFVPSNDTGIDGVYDTARELVRSIDLYRGLKVIYDTGHKVNREE